RRPRRRLPLRPHLPRAPPSGAPLLHAPLPRPARPGSDQLHLPGHRAGVFRPSLDGDLRDTPACPKARSLRRVGGALWARVCPVSPARYIIAPGGNPRMSKIESYVPGSFCWAELATTDAAAAKHFYGEMFGWTAVDI